MHQRRKLLSLLLSAPILCWLFFSVKTEAADISNRFRLAQDLVIYQIASDTEVPDCTCITVDSQDRIFAGGPKYIRMLTLDLKNSQYETITNVTQDLKQAPQGLHVENQSLYVVADAGIWELQFKSNEMYAATRKIKHLQLPTGGEHQAHALRRGKDNHWYLIVGNDCDSMMELQNSENPLISEPRAGMIWRFSSNWKQREVVAHGLRNAYDFDFLDNGDFVTYDSDGERDVSLPWYLPTRVFQISPSDDAGWVTRSWKRPNHDPEMPRVIAELGRGSPTGVKRSRGNRLPARFNGGTFVCDWTFGRLLHLSDSGEVELVAQPNDYSGFALTDIETLSDGRIIVSVGGRGTRGGIYMIDSKTPQQVNSLLDKTPAQKSKKIQPPPTSTNTHPSQVKNSEIKQQLIRLRRQKTPQLDNTSSNLAILEIERCVESGTHWLEPLALLIESVGGLGKGDPKDARGKTQVTPVFDGYRGRIRPQINPQQINRVTDILLDNLEHYRKNSAVHAEMIRTLAVLEPERNDVIERLVDELQVAESPILKLHCLIAIARIPSKRTDTQTEEIADEMLRTVRGIDKLNLKTDRHWPLRISELFEALRYRDSLLPSRLVAHVDFGNASDLVWMERMDPENLERARNRMLRSESLRNQPQIAGFIARGNDVVPRPYMRQWLAASETFEAGMIALANDARLSDVDVLKAEAWSSNQEIRKRVRDGLKRLEVEIPPRPQQSPSVLSWSNRADLILKSEGDINRGSEIYETQQCKKCHEGSRALGPRLEGIAKRFGPSDLLRSIYDPSHTIPDRYQSRIIITNDGERVEGIPIYESVDGITISTAEGRTMRIEHELIKEMKISNVSSMPEGLLDRLSDSEVMSLLQFLQDR